MQTYTWVGLSVLLDPVSLLRAVHWDATQSTNLETSDQQETMEEDLQNSVQRQGEHLDNNRQHPGTEEA